ncbi:MAG: phosphotransferase family protein [Planctomycetota bacterium]
MKIKISQARELISPQLGAGDWRVEPFGAGKFSETFAVSGDGGEYVLRVAPPDSVLQLFYERRMMRQEPTIHARLLAETGAPVPPIAAYDFSRRLIDRDYLLMPKLPGEPLSRAGLSDDARRTALRQWGMYIAEIHGIADEENRFGYLGEHNCMEPQPTWADAFAVMFRKELDDIVACGVYDEPQAGAAMKLLERNLRHFQHCDRSRLLHGDIWVTNLLVRPDGEVTGVLDFDRACWGDVEWDLAIAEYCGVTRPAFWAGYGRRVERHEGDAAIRRMFYLLYEHQKYIVISMSSRRSDPAGAKRYAADCLAVMENFRRTGRPEF